jgi:hypothetical protein
MKKKPLWFVIYNEIKVAKWPPLFLNVITFFPLPLMFIFFYNQTLYLEHMGSNSKSWFSGTALYTHWITVLMYSFFAVSLTLHQFKPYFRDDETFFNAISSQFGILIISSASWVVIKKTTSIDMDVGFILLIMIDFTCLSALTHFYNTFSKGKKSVRLNHDMLRLPVFGRQLLTYTIDDICANKTKSTVNQEDVSMMIKRMVKLIRNHGHKLTPAFWDKNYEAMFLSKGTLANSLGLALLKLKKYYHTEYLFEIALKHKHDKVIKILLPHLRDATLLDSSTKDYLRLVHLPIDERFAKTVRDDNDRDSFLDGCKLFLIEHADAMLLGNEYQKQWLTQETE